MFFELFLDVINVCERGSLLLIAYLHKGDQSLFRKRKVNAQSLITTDPFIIPKELMYEQGSKERRSDFFIFKVVDVRIESKMN